jgi:hypothetical protein
MQLSSGRLQVQNHHREPKILHINTLTLTGCERKPRFPKSANTPIIGGSDHDAGGSHTFGRFDTLQIQSLSEITVSRRLFDNQTIDRCHRVGELQLGITIGLWDVSFAFVYAEPSGSNQNSCVRKNCPVSRVVFVLIADKTLPLKAFGKLNLSRPNAITEFVRQPYPLCACDLFDAELFSKRYRRRHHLRLILATAKSAKLPANQVPFFNKLGNVLWIIASR